MTDFLTFFIIAAFIAGLVLSFERWRNACIVCSHQPEYHIASGCIECECMKYEGRKK